MRDLHCALCHIFRIFQELEEVFASLLLVGGVLGQVAPRLAEEPHRDALHTLAAGSANHEVVLEWRQRARVGHRGGAAGAGGAAGGACGAARLVRRSQRERRCAAERSGDEAEAAAHDSAPKLKEMKDSGLPLQLCTYIKIKRGTNHRHKKHRQTGDTTLKKGGSQLNYLDQTQTITRKLG